MVQDERFQIVRPLGVDATAFVARDTSVKPARLVVLQRATRSATSAEDRARIVKRCRALVGLEHPKVVPVREVLERDGEVLVVCDFVDGEWLSALLSLDPRPPVEVLLRILLDVLEGVAALHDKQDDKGHSLRMVHGSLSPDTILVADDGVAEIARTLGVAFTKPDRFVAPELRRGETAVDVRADVYSAGAILREILGMASSDAKWAEQLTDIAWRACSVDPENRWPGAGTMATTLRRVAGNKLASADDVASFLRRNFGARIRARRASLEPDDEAAPPSSEPISVRPADIVIIDPSNDTTLVEPRPRVHTSKPPALPHTAIKETPETIDVLNLLQPGFGRPAPHVGQVTQRGMPVVMPPPVVHEPALVLTPTPAPKVVSLPPPDIVVPEEVAVAAPASASPASAPPTEDYRRRLPTFPTIDEPPRRSTAVQAMAVATAMVTTFGVGWWLGRNYPPPGEIPQSACPSVVAPMEAQGARAPIEPSPALTGLDHPEPSTAAGGPAPTSSSTPRSATPATSLPATAVTPNAATSVPPVAPKPAATWTSPGVPKPTGTPSSGPTAPEPKPTEPVGPPRPAGSAGFVPNEL